MTHMEARRQANERNGVGTVAREVAVVRETTRDNYVSHAVPLAEVQDDDLISLSEFYLVLPPGYGLHPRTAYSWKYRGQLPEPDLKWKDPYGWQRDLWRVDVVRSWYASVMRTREEARGFADRRYRNAIVNAAKRNTLPEDGKVDEEAWIEGARPGTRELILRVVVEDETG